MNSGYLLSVVIPTRNRQYYAKKTVEQVLSIADEVGTIQIVVTDNSDDDSLSQLLGELLKHPDVTYEFTPYRIPGVDNYAKGIGLSKGQYVCCIGDDDAVLPDIVPVAEWASSHNIPAVKFGTQAIYIWPNAIKGRESSQLSLDRFSSRSYEVDVKRELVDFLHTGCFDLPSADIPKAYHGLVRRDMYELIKEKTGRYCGGLSPDIYLAVSLATMIEKLTCMDIPLTVFGACRQSTTGDSLNKVNVSKLEDAPHFVGQEYEWDSLVPRYYCGANIWADSALHALSDLGENALREEFSVEHIAAYGLAECSDFQDEIMALLDKVKHDDIKIAQLVKDENKQKHLRAIKDGIKSVRVLSRAYYAVRKIFRTARGDDRLFLRDVASCAEAAGVVHGCIESCVKELLENLQREESELA